ncbi:MAG: aminodeoxychorismate synthase component I [Verrucomicrobiota bacterium]
MPVIELKVTQRLSNVFGWATQKRHCLWLDASSGGRGSEWSILSWDPIETREGPAEDLVSWMDEWAEKLRKYPSEKVPFCGGLMGHLDYQNQMPPYPSNERFRPTGWLGLYACALIEHAPSQTLFAVAGPWVDDADAILEAWVGKVPFSSTLREHKQLGKRSTMPSANVTKDQYMTAVRKCREWIASGDIYQVNLSQRFHCKWNGSAEELYRSLRQSNPAPYSAYVDCGKRKIFSSSPELFLAIDSSGWIETRPIKGTRPRSSDPTTDQLQAEALMSSEKEQAELLMIVDMERNDLGRICEPGSVSGEISFALESYASVHHLVGTVQGRLKEHLTWREILGAVFPGGSITGAPKVRAMEIIRDLESEERNAFCGTIGFLSVGGCARWSIAIRTIEMKGDAVDFGVGAGIVWDSDPAMEYEETLEKARKLFVALGWSLEEWKDR